MEELKQAILTRGRGVGNDIVKVDSFLNHQVDVELTTKMGQFIHDSFADEQVDLILTVETSGIPAAFAAAQAFGNIPLVFAKKGTPTNLGIDVYTSQVYSFTHNVMNTIRVSRNYLKEGQRVLIVDDFLANGKAILGLVDIVRQAGCIPVGAAVCVEKGWQEGGKKLRAQGFKVISLATVTSIEDGKITLAD